jgi:hypothetical protein
MVRDTNAILTFSNSIQRVFNPDSYRRLIYFKVESIIERKVFPFTNRAGIDKLAKVIKLKAAKTIQERLTP